RCPQSTDLAAARAARRFLVTASRNAPPSERPSSKRLEWGFRLAKDALEGPVGRRYAQIDGALTCPSPPHDTSILGEPWNEPLRTARQLTEGQPNCAAKRSSVVDQWSVAVLDGGA